MSRPAPLLFAAALVLAANAHADPALPAPTAIHLRDLDGRAVTFADYQKDVTVVALWATWCPPCLAELASLQALYAKYEDDPRVAVLAVSIDGDEAAATVREVVAQQHLTLPVVRDHAHELSARWFPARVKAHELTVPVLIIMSRQWRGLLDDAGVDPKERPAGFVRRRAAQIAAVAAGRLKKPLRR